jgi:hypothetical protein
VLDGLGFYFGGAVGLRCRKASQRIKPITITRNTAIDILKTVPLYHLSDFVEVVFGVGLVMGVGVSVAVGVGTTGARVANTVKCVTVAVSV